MSISPPLPSLFTLFQEVSLIVEKGYVNLLWTAIVYFIVNLIVENTLNNVAAGLIGTFAGKLQENL